MDEGSHGKWLLLIHQIPPKPGYLRVKIWRKLQALGAVLIKNSVYVIPRNEETLEDFQWVLKEIVQGGGEAAICTASFVEGLTDKQVERLFQEARNAEYAQIAADAHACLEATPTNPAMWSEEDRSVLEAEWSKLKKRLSSVEALDFFHASGKEAARSLLSDMERRAGEMKRAALDSKESPGARAADLTGKTWVTRKGVYVDRIACAWLIRRFIDPHAQFRFVTSKGYRPKTGEIRFDMYEGEFTHHGDLCTFEVLVELLFSAEDALLRMGQIIHDLDLKETKFGRPETAGIGGLLQGLASAHKSDEMRIERGSAMFDDLYEFLRRI